MREEGLNWGTGNEERVIEETKTKDPYLQPVSYLQLTPARKEKISFL